MILRFDKIIRNLTTRKRTIGKQRKEFHEKEFHEKVNSAKKRSVMRGLK